MWMKFVVSIRFNKNVWHYFAIWINSIEVTSNVTLLHFSVCFRNIAVGFSLEEGVLFLRYIWTIIYLLSGRNLFRFILFHCYSNLFYFNNLNFWFLIFNYSIYPNFIGIQVILLIEYCYNFCFIINSRVIIILKLFYFH